MRCCRSMEQNNSTSCTKFRVLLDLAEIIPPVGQYVIKVYGSEPLTLLHALGHGRRWRFNHRGGFSKGAAGPLGYSAGGIKILEGLQDGTTGPTSANQRVC